MNEMSSATNHWTNAEVQSLLCVAADERVLTELDAFHNEPAYQTISLKMALRGYERSSRQCRGKLKKMKSHYFRIKKHNLQNPADQQTCKWYSQLDTIFGERPTKKTVSTVPQRTITKKPHSASVHQKAPPKRLPGREDALPLSSLRLLVSPLQLMSAVLWGVVQHRAVMHYGLLEDFITAVLDIIPELLTHSERVQLVMGLRAKMVLEMCQSDDLRDRQNIEPHLNRIDDLINQEDDEASSSAMKASIRKFSQVVNTLLDDSYQRAMFYETTFPTVFGSNFDSALCTLVKKFLLNLEKGLPFLSLDQASLWLGLSPPVLKECGDILNQPEPLSKLLQHHKHGYKFLPVHHDDSIFSSFNQISIEDTDSKAAQKFQSSAPGEAAALFERTLADDADSDTDPQDCNTSVEFVYQRQSDSRKTFSCLICGQGFGSLFEMKRHSLSGCSAHTAKEKGGACDGREDKLNDHEAKTKRRDPSNETGEAERDSPDGLQQFSGSDTFERQMCESGRRDTCSVCEETFTSSTDLTNHMRVHGEGGFHICGRCGEEFDNNENYTLHQEKGCRTSAEYSMEAEHSHEMSQDDDSFEAIIIEPCDLQYPGNTDENNGTDAETQPDQSPRQSGRTTSNQTTMRCTLCEKTFSKLIIMRRHYQYTHNIQYQFPCPACERTFVRLYDLVKHHENRPLFQCDACKWCFMSQAEWSHHKKQFSDTCALLYKCEICGKKFKDPEQLKQHKGVHLNRLVCSYCGKSFSDKNCLRTHMHRHMGSFSCPVCPKVFHQKIFLQRHMDRHDGKEPYLCEVCGKGWPTERYLKVHMVKHSHERPFTCGQCGARFKSKNVLQTHFRRKHANIKPFNCSVCGRAFGSPKDLKHHMMKHTGARPFVCSRCGKGFTRSGYLKTHQERKCI